MDNVVHLTNNQRNKVFVDNPMFDKAVDLPDEELPAVIKAHLEGDDDATERLVLGNIELARWLVCRYLYHWPSTRPFEEDMCSEAVATIVEYVGQMEEPEDNFRAKLVTTMKARIEYMLNSQMPTFSASLSTNFSRLREGRSPEQVFAQAMSGEVNVPVWDDGPAFLEALEALETFGEADREEIVDLVLLALENNGTSNLSSKQRNLLNELSRSP